MGTGPLRCILKPWARAVLTILSIIKGHVTKIKLPVEKVAVDDPDVQPGQENKVTKA